MQGQRGTVQSLPETFEFDHASSSSNPAVDQPLYWNNMLNPVDMRNSPDFLYSPGDPNISFTNTVSHEDGSLTSWNLSGPSSSNHAQNQSSHEEAKMDHGWTASVTTHSGSGLRLGERRFEPSNILTLENVNINLNANQDANGPFHLQNSSPDDVPPNATFNAGFVGNGGQVMEAGLCPNLYKPGGSETEQIPSAGSSSDATPSGTVDYLADDNDGNRPGCSLDSRRLSCKRKTLEGVSGSSSLSGSPSCFQRAESSVWHTVPARHNAASSSNISSSVEHFSGVSQDEQMNPRFDVGMRIPSDYHPALSIAGNAETPQRNFRMRINPAHQQESATPTLWTPPGSAIRRSHIWSSQQPSSSRVLPINQPLDSRSAAASTSSQTQSRAPHVPGFPQNVHPFPWNGAVDARSGSSSNSPVISGERASALREEGNSRSMPRSIPELPMFVPATDIRHLTQDPTSWNLANGNINIPGNVASGSRIGSSSGVHPPPAPSTWIPHHNPPTRHHRRLSEVVRRSFPSSGSGSVGQNSYFPPPRTAPASSHEMVLPSGAGHQVQQSYLRSAFLMDRQGDGVLGVPLSLRTLATVPEGRSRLSEDILILDQSVFYGVDLHDRHRDMRLDVDNMSYEELLALEERIGNVSTGLSGETVLKCLKQRKYVAFATEATAQEVEPCCICQEEYVDGEELGTLDCGHDFHTDCIKQWLTHKNLCPICKTTALVT
ncbi:probable E3 ubiquitin-protein ligase HIP1 isoform X2 [Magnolia sinica]|uniref:probable E3 ubiquitin-protein ligase HIP1 isoform X2 n=1 Tax=Magnolia sinica TaxID=86752 RepID=UPI00265A3851|nr:probable E3 ubiquitin-protein ligase HIP1 isoform X2 [Magnolia sinica]